MFHPGEDPIYCVKKALGKLPWQISGCWSRAVEKSIPHCIVFWWAWQCRISMFSIVQSSTLWGMFHVYNDPEEGCFPWMNWGLEYYLIYWIHRVIHDGNPDLTKGSSKGEDGNTGSTAPKKHDLEQAHLIAGNRWYIGAITSFLWQNGGFQETRLEAARDDSSFCLADLNRSLKIVRRLFVLDIPWTCLFLQSRSKM